MLTKIIAEKLVQQSYQLIDEVEKIAIVTHISPDGDAVGASLGLYHFLYAIDKEASVIVPNRFASFLSWLPGSQRIIIYDEQTEKADQILQSADLLFAVDFNVTSRVGKMSEVLKTLKCKKILIDHHRDPESFCDVTISYPNIASTSELVFRLICRMGFFEQINKPCAEAIYTGMMTDTGAFTYNSNHPEIYFIISELLTKGINKDEIYNKVYNTYSVDRMKLMGYVLSSRMEILPEYRTAIISLTNEELNRYNYQEGDTEGFVNIPLSIKGIVFSVLIKENDGFVKLSLRSRGSFPVNKVAGDLFRGGGHINAAGGESYDTLDATIAKLKAALPDYESLLSAT
jgi:phosphoesterase RecJ-like protein